MKHHHRLFLSWSPIWKPSSLYNIEEVYSLPNWFKSFTCLKHLRINSYSKLKYLSPNIQHLFTLKYLRIDECNELDLSNEEVNTWQGAHKSLVHLYLRNLPQLETLYEGLQSFTTIKSLTIQLCFNLIALPEWIISNLTSLAYFTFGGAIIQHHYLNVYVVWPLYKHWQFESVQSYFGDVKGKKARIGLKLLTSHIWICGPLMIHNPLFLQVHIQFQRALLLLFICRLYYLLFDGKHNFTLCGYFCKQAPIENL